MGAARVRRVSWPHRPARFCADLSIWSLPLAVSVVGGDMPLLVGLIAPFFARSRRCVMHFVLYAMYKSRQADLAFDTLTFYLFWVHVPLHYIEVLNEETFDAYMAIAFAFTASFCLALEQKKVVIGHVAQKIVIAHVLSTFINRSTRINI